MSLKTCRSCQISFSVTDIDKEFLKKFPNTFDGQKFELPEPTQCLDCRMQNKMAFKNSLKIYMVKSALSGKEIFSIYPPSSPFPIYSVDEWNSDEYDGRQYGRNVDFTKPFFQQFHELELVVPHLSNENQESVNCDYNVYISSAKDCYYSYNVRGGCSNVYYSYSISKSDSCFNCFNVRDNSDYLQECVLCFRCHYASYLFLCYDCRDSHYCLDCRNCSNCLFCHNLRNKEYYIFNKPVSKEDFKIYKEKVINGSYKQHIENIKQLAAIYPKTVFGSRNTNSEDCTGFSLVNCKNVTESIHCSNTENGRYLWTVGPKTVCHTAMDIYHGGIAEITYNCSGNGGRVYDVQAGLLCRRSSFLRYCMDCLHCEYCFGCTNLHHQKYCILNKQYTKEEYEKIVAKLIAHMMKTPLTDPKGSQKPLGSCEWGEFFPMSISAVPYNNSVAQTYYPLTEKVATEKGMYWLPEEKKDQKEQTYLLPDSVYDMDDKVIHELLSCVRCKKNYKMIKQELVFHKQFNYPAPRECPDCRHKRRFQIENPYKLITRKCALCDKEIYTTYPLNHPSKICCDECYLQSLV